MSFNKGQLTQIISAIAALHKDTAALLNARSSMPAPESQAERELSAFRKESVQVAYNQANLLIEVSDDQLLALSRSLTEPVLTVAPWTSCRSVLETTALAAWLLAPDIGVRERVQRSFSYRFEGLSQQVKYAHALGRGTSDIISRIVEVEELAVKLDFPKIENSKGIRIGIGQEFPRITDLIGSVLYEEANYRFFSAITHAHHWAFTQSSFMKSGDTSRKEDNYSYGTICLEKQLLPESMIYLCHTAAYAFARPIWYQAQLYGYELGEYRATLNRIFDTLLYQPDGRFWNG